MLCPLMLPAIFVYILAGFSFISPTYINIGSLAWLPRAPHIVRVAMQVNV